MLTPYNARLPALLEDYGPEPSVERHVLQAVSIIALLFGSALIAACFFDLLSAASAPGVVSPEGYRKTVQHLEGGIVADLRVNEGDRVKKGQVLLTISDVQSQAAYRQALELTLMARARIVRLRAEQAGRRTLAFPESLTRDCEKTGMSQILADQKHVFEQNWLAFDSDIAVLKEQAEQAYQEIQTFKVREDAAVSQIKLLEEELADAAALDAKGLALKPKVMLTRRTLAAVSGQRDEARAESERTARQLNLLSMQVRQKTENRAADLSNELDKTQTDLAQQVAKTKAASDAVQRTEITAPVSGLVMNLKVHNSGSVVGAGQAILEIVPESEGLAIDAKIGPRDIDVVHPGLPARIRFVAFNQRRTPEIAGVVESVSGDRIVDERTGEAHYLARIKPDANELKNLPLGLQAGMPVEVLVTTGRKRIIDYMLAPLQDRMAKALIED